MSKKLSEKLWWRKLAFAGAAIAMLPLNLLAQDVDTGDEELEELEAFTMVGSRIKRIDQEPINPVVSASRQDLEATGYTSLGDAVKNLSFSSGQSISDDTGSSSFGYGAKTANFRGLGNNNVLMLVNGRRTAPYGSAAFDGYQTVFDLNSIPISAVQGYEILKDGGSALYGSDAVSGVVNIKMRTDYEGMNTSLKVGNYENTDGARIEASVLIGTTTNDTSILFSADYKKQNAVYARDLSWQANNADLRAYVDVAGIDDYFATAYGEAYRNAGYGDSYADGRSTYGWPARVYVSGSDAVDEDGYYTFTGPTSTPTADTAVAYNGETNGRYDFAKDYSYTPSIETHDFYARAQKNITDSLHAFIEVMYNDSTVESASAPAPMVATDQGDSPSGGIYIPSDNPYNPFGVDIDTWRYRAVQAGNRTSSSTSVAPRILAGLEGEFSGDWTWTSGALWAKNTVTASNFNIHDDALQAALHGVLLKDEVTGVAETMYLNPFGESNDEIIDYISGFDVSSSYTELYNYDFSTSGTVMQLPAGPLGLSLGTEYREEHLVSRMSDAHRTGNIVGGSWIDDSVGYRNVSSLYFEAVAPITKWLELQLAGRYESYSDFGDTSKPKIALKFRPIESIQIRASYGQSFLAPNLNYMYASNVVTFTNKTYTDALRPGDPATQIEQHGGGNPDLTPEETDTYFLGVSWEPSGFLEGLHVSAQYYRFYTDDVITQFDADDILKIDADLVKYYTEQGYIIRKSPVGNEQYGKIAYINSFYQNLGNRDWRGLDMSVNYEWETENYGSFNVGGTATWIQRYKIDENEQADMELTPDWVGTLQTQWSYGDFTTTLYARYTDSRKGELEDGMPAVNGFNIYESYTRVNATVRYTGFEYFDVTLGVENLLDKDPPISVWGSFGTSAGLFSTTPRSWMLTISRDW